jgi:hypothetical protein
VTLSHPLVSGRLLRGLVVAAVLVPAGGAAQDTTDAYASEEARALVRLARVRRQSVDRRIVEYETKARERISVSLRTKIGEKLIYRRETATAISWERDGPLQLDVSGMREVSPLFDGNPDVPFDLSAELLRLAFDPANPEAILDASPADTAGLRNPLRMGSEAHYRFAAGDTQSITLPGGETIRLRELRFEPRRSDPRLLRGSYWLEDETHAVVRAYFTLARAYDADLDENGPVLVTRGPTPDGSSAGNEQGGERGAGAEAVAAPLRVRQITAADLPGFIKPFRADVDFIAIEYGLWDLEWWLPRRVVARGVVQLSRFRVPLAYERAYDEYSVRGDAGDSAATQPVGEPCRTEIVYAASSADPAADSVRQLRTDAERRRREAWSRALRAASGDSVEVPACVREVLITAPSDSALVRSPNLPATIYGDDIEMISEEELGAVLAGVAATSGVPWQVGMPRLQWPWQGSGLLRYNRVEALSLGGRAIVDLGAATLATEVRFGTADRTVRGEAAVERSGDAAHTRFAAYRRLPSVVGAGDAHGVMASLGAAVFGRDDGEYYDAIGADVVVRPPDARSQWYDLRLFRERQRAVERGTHVSLARLLDGDHRFRENFAADAADQLGARLRLRAWFGLDPAAPRLAGELSIGAERGDYDLFSSALRLNASLPLGTAWNVAVEGAAGTVEGARLPAQSLWRLGGPETLRGYPGGALVGERYWRARGEVGWGGDGARLTLFSDVAWAGPRARFRVSGALPAVGVGAALLDGTVRLDLARGLRSPGGWRLHLHLAGF